jgi:hypothetical protein
MGADSVNIKTAPDLFGIVEINGATAESMAVV